RPRAARDRQAAHLRLQRPLVPARQPAAAPAGQAAPGRRQPAALRPAGRRRPGGAGALQTARRRHRGADADPALRPLLRGRPRPATAPASSWPPPTSPASRSSSGWSRTPPPRAAPPSWTSASLRAAEVLPFGRIDDDLLADLDERRHGELQPRVQRRRLVL